MGVFDKLGRSLGLGKELSVEEYMTSEEMKDVDILNEPADFYIKPFALVSEEDVAVLQAELGKRNIMLVNITEALKRPNTLKSMIAALKEYVTKINGDIAQIDNDKILIVPARVKIVKSKKAQASSR